MAMESSSMYEKNLDRICGEKLKKTLSKTLLKNSPFDMKVFGSKISRDKHLEVYEKLAQKPTLNLV